MVSPVSNVMAPLMLNISHKNDIQTQNEKINKFGNKIRNRYPLALGLFEEGEGAL